jgi:hypothetical protein
MLEIVIWISPTDLNDLEKSLHRLGIGQKLLSDKQRSQIRFNIVMGVSDEIIDWSKSTVSKEQCIDEFQALKPLTDWAGVSEFTASTEISGCTSMRRISSYSDSKWYLWLDTDIVYDPKTLVYMLHSIESVESAGYSKFVISPEIVRQWDETWDCLVNERFIAKPIGYQATNNPYIDTIIESESEMELEVVHNRNPIDWPFMKFGGGWFTVISKPLLDAAKFPKNYGHYGLDDTYVMWAAQILNDPMILQFKIRNVIVCENYFDRITTHKDKISFIDRREEYLKQNEELFTIGLNELIKSNS